MSESRRLTEDIEPASASSEQPAISPDSPVYGIKWPANRLTAAQMRTLRQISKDVRLPITQLLKDAVDVYLSLIQKEMQSMMVAEPMRQGELFDSDTATISHERAADEDASGTASSDENSPTG